ncbi:MAG: type II secretion system protein [Dehalococcoidia bacterium]|nr:type II secretion system protein [Dehalococcoidia bacterium]
MKAFLRRLSNDQAGLTAIELAVVVAILAILAALVAGSTSGMSTNARGASKSTDISEVQKAVDNYRGQEPHSYFPIATQASTVVTNTSIAFGAYFVTPDTVPLTKTLVSDFMQRNPKHATDSSLGATDGSCPTSLTNNNTWYIDSTGKVGNCLLDSAY